ncbi:MAG: hypothetical protein LBD29_10100 [Treponema sp.]|jgi:hypothetical protein|nr:hypothetical protein [Treponema sp.]
MIDMRRDTIIKPTDSTGKAMAEAGDGVYSIHELERPGTELLGKKAALFTMPFFTFPPAKKSEKADQIVETFTKQGAGIHRPDENGVFRFIPHFWIRNAETNAVLEARTEAFKL